MAKSDTNGKFSIQGIPHKLVIDCDGKLVAYGHLFSDVNPALEAPLVPEKPAQAAKPAEQKGRQRRSSGGDDIAAARERDRQRIEKPGLFF